MVGLWSEFLSIVEDEYRTQSDAERATVYDKIAGRLVMKEAPKLQLYRNSKVSLFELFQKAGIIAADVDPSVVADRCGKQTGNIIVSHLPVDEQMAAIINTGWYQFHQGFITEPMAVRMISLVFEKNATQAQLVGVVFSTRQPLIGDLLQGAGFLSNKQLLAALLGSEAMKMKLGAFLIETGTAPELISVALQIQNAIRHSAISIDLAMTILRRFKDANIAA